MIVSQAYTAVMALCSDNPQEFDGYTSHLGKYDPKKTEFKMLDEYEEIVTKDPKPGIADTVWVDAREMVMVLKGDSDWKIEVRNYTNKTLFNEHLDKIKEMNRMVN